MMTQAKQAEHSLWQRDVETPGSGGHRFMAWVGTTVQQHGNSHIPSFFPATWTVCARLSHPALPAVGLSQVRVLHSPLTLLLLLPSPSQENTSLVFSPGWSIPAPLRFLSSHQEELWVKRPGGFLQRELQGG